MTTPRSRTAPITPLKLPRGVHTLLVYGGSFDPPHAYHELIPRVILERLFMPGGRLLYVPAAQSPLKEAPGASDAHRLAMLRLALRTPGQRLIWTDELDRAAWDQALGSPPQSFTIHTLERLRRVIPARVNVRLLIGADQASTFHKWKSFRRVLRLAEPVVLPRGAITDVDALFASLDNSAWTAREKAAWCTRMAPAPAITISSTAIRRALARSPRTPKSWARHDVLRHIDPAVARYIVTQRLYSND